MDGSVDEVRLEGTWNVPLTAERQTKLLAEVKRILRPGGKVFVHCLVGDRPRAGAPPIAGRAGRGRRVAGGHEGEAPGLASLVRHVPIEHEVQAALQAAGFEHLFYETLGDVNCLRQEGVDLRQCLLVGHRPAGGAGCGSRLVLYRGPLAQVRDEQGNVYPRGVRVAVTPDTAERLRSGPAADQFALLASEEASSLPMAKGCCNG
jgi:hypothetical protein